MRPGRTRILALSLATDTIGKLTAVARHLGISRSGVADLALTKWLDTLNPDDLPPVDEILPEEMPEALERRRSRRKRRAEAEALMSANHGDQHA